MAFYFINDIPNTVVIFSKKQRVKANVFKLIQTKNK